MGSNTAAYFKQNIQKKWFDYWLKGIGDGNFSEQLFFKRAVTNGKRIQAGHLKKQR